MTDPGSDIEGQALDDVDVDVTRFRSAQEWAQLRATDIDRYRAELGQWLGGEPGLTSP